MGGGAAGVRGGLSCNVVKLKTILGGSEEDEEGYEREPEPVLRFVIVHTTY
jgi:hypothetical protein